jgi:predicted porin
MIQIKIGVATLCTSFFICATAHAHSGVVLYGRVDQSLGYIHSSSGNSIVGINDGAILRSRIGVRGSEDLANENAITYALEQGISADSGEQAVAGRIFDRQAWIGHKSAIGEFRIGRQNSELFYAGGAYDYVASTTFGSVRNSFGSLARTDNDVSYQSPRIDGMRLAVHHALAEDCAANNRCTSTSQIVLDRTLGRYRIGYAGMVSRPRVANATEEKKRSHNFYATYDYGSGTIYGVFTRANNETGEALVTHATVDGNSNPLFHIYQISADYRFGNKVRVGALWGVISDRSGQASGARGANVGGFYEPSKRTTLYAFASWLKNDANAGFRFSGSAPPSANLEGSDVVGKSLIGFQLGITHAF